MTELFNDIPEDIKHNAEFIFNLIIKSYSSPKKIGETLNNYVKIHSDEYTQNFLNFYFNLRLEELKNGDNTNIVG